jgi:hypothetical protein
MVSLRWLKLDNSKVVVGNDGKWSVPEPILF